MKNVNVRLATPEDAPKILAWASDHIGNLPAFLYPASRILATENGKPLQYALIHSVCMLEGMAPNPEASDLELARGLIAMNEAVSRIAAQAGMRELITMSSDLDRKLEHIGPKLGWTGLDYKVWRKRL